VTSRGTDWGLALLVTGLFASGLLGYFAGTPGSAWVIAVHDGLGFALALLVAVKLRRVWRRLREQAPVTGLLATLFVSLALVSGWLWASGWTAAPAGYSVLVWHTALGAALTLAVGVHLALRAKPIRRRDIANRRQFLQATAFAAGAAALWGLQRPAQRLFDLRAARRRFTGSYETGSYGGEFPPTSWVADSPRVLDAAAYRLKVTGLVDRDLELTAGDLDGGDTIEATIDCTGGWYSRQHWRGVSVGRLIDRAGPRAAATHVRVVSHTGYRWGFEIADARRLLLATRVADGPLTHEHGAPARLVVPGARGFQWVKWVTRLELHDGPDAGAPAATVLSSLSPRGRGAD
jgi:DMSO/TMAO reductase YedYZ molybdopterin-dependent catalytic subunit